MEEQIMKALIEKATEYAKKHRYRPLDDVNLFSILNMENKEVSAHEAFLYFVFKPFTDDNGKVDDLHLRILLENILDIDRDSIHYADIRKEVWTDFGRLDFLIEYDCGLIVIELKVWAKEQHEQITRYEKYIQQNTPEQDGENEVFFLTPCYREATTGKAKNITLKENIRKVLNEIVEVRRNQGKNAYCEILKQYVNLIDKLTNYSFTEEDMEIFKTSEELIAVDCLVKKRKEVLKSLLMQFFEKLKAEFENSYGEVCIEGDNAPKASLVEYKYGENSLEQYYSSSKQMWPAIAFKVEDCKLKNGYEFDKNIGIYFLIEISWNLYAGLTPRRVEELATISKEELDSYQKNSGVKLKGVFFDWEHIKLNNKKIGFKEDILYEDNSFLKQLLVNNTLEIDVGRVKEIANQIKDIYVTQCKRFFI